MMLGARILCREVNVMRVGCWQRTPARTLFSSLRGPRAPLLRFAPSPTGQLHLGGLRTALFNQLFAKKYGGKWILRIEDTDQKRQVHGATEAMQDILAWAGLHYDEGPDRPGKCGPFYQSQRLHIYSAYAQRLLDSGHAFRDFRAEGNDDVGEYLAPTEEETQALLSKGIPFTVRLRMPRTTVELHDLVYGHLTFPYDEATVDPVLVKSDGWPTYHLANIVDDHEMDITHVLRGEEWLPSVPIHLSIYKALSLEPPTFAHLPLLVNSDGSKLSKRHADVHVESYRQQGYEPEALVNFVGLMGYNWHGSAEEVETTGAGENSEVFTMADMIERFEPSRIAHSRATPNQSKLTFLNKQHLTLKLREGGVSQRHDIASRLTKMIQTRWPSEEVTGYLGPERVSAMADVFAGRADNLQELVDELVLFFEQPDWSSSEAKAMLSVVGAVEYERVIWKAHDFLSAMHGRDVERLPYLEAALKDLSALVDGDKVAKGGSKKQRRGMAALMRPLRLALTAKKSGPTVAETISLLGQGLTLQRLEAAMVHLSTSTSAS